MAGMYIDTRDVVRALVPAYAKGKALDIGGGTSKYRALIVPHVESYLVSDIAAGPGVDVVADARDLSFPSASFDTAFSFQVLEHVDDTAAVVRELYRVLAPGGIAIATAPFMEAEHGHPSDYHRFTPQGMAWHFEQAGFAVVESGKQGSTCTVLAELIRFSLLNPYRSHGRIRTALVMRLCRALKALDRRGFLRDPDLYVNVYLVARKRA